VLDGEWVKGSKLNGTPLAPAADWLRVMPGGSLRLDVRGTIRTAEKYAWLNHIQCRREGRYTSSGYVSHRLVAQRV